MAVSETKFGAVIIGGGPAGMLVGAGCANACIATLLIEKRAAVGGQMLWTFNPVIGYPASECTDALEIARGFANEVESSKTTILTGTRIRSADLSLKCVRTDDGRTFCGDVIVIATGVRRRKLGIPGEDELAGHGILVSGARDRELVRGKTVVIVGGGDAALENAIILSEYAARVFIIHRRRDFSALREFVEMARSKPNVEFLMNATVGSIRGEHQVEAVDILGVPGNVSRIACDAVLIRVGVVPNTELFIDQVEVDDKGFVITDQERRTNVPGVWAVGDVTGPSAMTIAHAVSDASTALKAIKARET
jgi:thioredoxin reductase (NADPH)